MSSVRVLMVTDAFGLGGAERQLALLASSMPDDWTVRVVSMSDGVFRDVLEAAHIQVTIARRSHRLDVRPAATVWRTVHDWRPSVVHTWGWMSTAAALPACRRWKVPLVDGSIRFGSCRRVAGRSSGSLRGEPIL